MALHKHHLFGYTIKYLTTFSPYSIIYLGKYKMSWIVYNKHKNIKR